MHVILSFFPNYIGFRCSDGRTGSQPGSTVEALQVILALFPGATVEAHSYYCG